MNLQITQNRKMSVELSPNKMQLDMFTDSALYIAQCIEPWHSRSWFQVVQFEGCKPAMSFSLFVRSSFWPFCTRVPSAVNFLASVRVWVLTGSSICSVPNYADHQWWQQRIRRSWTVLRNVESISWWATWCVRRHAGFRFGNRIRGTRGRHD